MSIMDNGKIYLCMVVLSIAAFISGFFAGHYLNRSGVSGIVTRYQNSETELAPAIDAHSRIENNLTNAGDGITTSFEGSVVYLRTIRSGIEGIESIAYENSPELSSYCSKLEQENTRLKSNNRGLKIGLGISGGTVGVLLAVLLHVLR
jgi:hypothetical protein